MFSRFLSFAIRLTFCVAVSLAALGCADADRKGPVQSLVVYTSQDQVYAQEILGEFTRKTGIEVKAVYDSEAVKTVGLANRLLAERNNPQCDIFWSNEELQTRKLSAEGVFRENDPWREFGYRSRKLVVNTNLMRMADAPTSLLELTNSVWRGKVALAYPMFGTTASHFLELRDRWGDQAWESWCAALQANKPLVVDGNSVVVKLVGAGEALIGLTDSDDIAAGRKNGLPVTGRELVEVFHIPNTVAIVRGSKNEHSAQQLSSFLCGPQVTQRLVEANALEGGFATAQTEEFPDWDAILEGADSGTRTLGRIFLR